MNELINYEAVCRTASATPGLLKNPHTGQHSALLYMSDESKVYKSTDTIRVQLSVYLSVGPSVGPSVIRLCEKVTFIVSDGN